MMKGLKRNMKKLKINALFLLLTVLNFNLALGHDFSVDLIKSTHDKKKVMDSLGVMSKDDEVVKNQIVLIKDNKNTFIIAPVISIAEKNGGCYLQSLAPNYKPRLRYLIERNINAQTCDAIIAVFGCRLAQKNGLGVVVGMRMGFDNYYIQSSYFDIIENNQLKNNDLLSQKIGSIESVVKAKKILDCRK